AFSVDSVRVNLNHVPIRIENVDLRITSHALCVDAHRPAGLVAPLVTAFRLEMRERRAEALRPQRKVPILERHTLPHPECGIARHDEMDFLIADAVPRAIEG